MSDKEWETFYDLMKKIVDQPKPYDEKMLEATGQAEANAAGSILTEFCGWFAD